VLEQVFRSVGAGALASPRNGGLITSNPDGAPRGGALGSIEQLELLVCEKLYIVIEEIWSDDLEALAQERERNQNFCHRNCPYCLCVGDGELVFSAGTSVEECARTRGSALLTMVFIGMCFLVFSFVEHRLNSAYL
jgi:hypothetical protein